MRLNQVQTELQAALDGAVLAGVTSSSGQEAAAKSSFDANLIHPDAKIIASSFKKSGNIRVDGKVTAEMPTTFAAMVGMDHLTLKLSSAASSSPEPDPLMCILALSPNESQSLLVNSGADVNAAGCEIHVKSTANPAAIFNAGTSIKAKKTCIQGSQIIKNGGTQTNLETACTTTSDPLAGKIPAPASTACDYNNQNFSGNVTINPGVYCGWHNFNSGSNVTLKPGTYVIKDGGWNVNGGTWTGAGVTFYYADTSKIQFNSAVKATLSAPTTGAYKDILMAEKEGLSGSQFIFNDNLGFEMTGVLYLPSREVVFNSNSTARSYKMTAVMRKVIFNQTKWTITSYYAGSGSGTVSARLLK